MTRLAQVDPVAAEGALAQTYAMIEGTLGHVPNMVRVMGTQPIYLDLYMGMRAKLAEGDLDVRTREAIAIAIADENDCSYCEAAHASAAINILNVAPKDVEAWRQGVSMDAAFDPILVLARQLNATRGAVTDTDLAAARAAGLSDANIIEVLAIVVMNIATNYFNRLAQTEVDFPIQAVAE